MKETPNFEQFNPEDEKYRTVVDLPKEAKEYFKEAPGGGFVFKSVLTSEDYTDFNLKYGKANELVDKSLMVTRVELSQRIRERIKEKMKEAGLLGKLKYAMETFAPSDDYQPSTVRQEVREEVLLGVMQEAALLTNEGLTKYPNLHFERVGAQMPKFKVGERSFSIGSVNPFRIKGAVKVDDKEHDLELVYGHYGGTMYAQREGPRGSTRAPLLYGAFLNGEDVGTTE